MTPEVEIMVHGLVKRALEGLVAAAPLAGAANADPTGIWLTQEGESRIEILACGEKLCGRIVWLAEPRNADGTPKVDESNGNETLRTRPIIGLEMMSGFAEAGDGKWTRGRIYNPEDGRTYRSRFELKDPDTLSVSGCVLVFCRAQTWTRIE